MQCPSVIYDLGNVTDWLTAVGTVGAIIVSLWIALRSSRERVDISLYVRNSFLHIVVANNNSAAVLLRELYFQVGWFRENRDDYLKGYLGESIPKSLAPYETFNAQFAFQYFKSYLPDYLYALAEKKLPWNRQLYFVAVTGSGRRHRLGIRSADRPIFMRKGE